MGRRGTGWDRTTAGTEAWEEWGHGRDGDMGGRAMGGMARVGIGPLRGRGLGKNGDMGGTGAREALALQGGHFPPHCQVSSPACDGRGMPAGGLTINVTSRALGSARTFSAVTSQCAPRHCSPWVCRSVMGMQLEEGGGVQPDGLWCVEASIWTAHDDTHMSGCP